jgi:hypothetical protein
MDLEGGAKSHGDVPDFAFTFDVGTIHFVGIACAQGTAGAGFAAIDAAQAVPYDFLAFLFRGIFDKQTFHDVRLLSEAVSFILHHSAMDLQGGFFRKSAL